MRRITIILFIVGLLFEFAAFFGDQAKNLPFVMRLVAPEYSHAQAGIYTLSTKKTLEPGERGFAVISEILFAQLRKKNKPEDVSRVSIQKFFRGTARIAFGQDRAREVIPIDVSLSNGQTLHWSLGSLTTEVDAMQNKNLFAYSLVVFLFGVFIQCIGFVGQYREDKRPKTIFEL